MWNLPNEIALRFAPRLVHPLPCLPDHPFQGQAEGVCPVDPEGQGRDALARFGPVKPGPVEEAGSRQGVLAGADLEAD